MYRIIFRKVLETTLAQSSPQLVCLFLLTLVPDTEMELVHRRDLFAGTAPCSAFVPSAPHLHRVSIFPVCFFFHIFIHKEPLH